MATVTVYTAARMQAIENASVVDGNIVGSNLILTRYDNSTIDAGVVVGPTGPTGPQGPAGSGVTDHGALTGLADNDHTQYALTSGLPALYVARSTYPVALGFALSDEATAITTGVAKLTARSPFAFTLTAVRASLTAVSTSGIPTVDINEAGVTLLSTKLTIDANELTSATAATAAVISDSAIADNAELTFDIDVAGTGAKGLKVWLIGTRVV